MEVIRKQKVTSNEGKSISRTNYTFENDIDKRDCLLLMKLQNIEDVTVSIC